MGRINRTNTHRREKFRGKPAGTQDNASGTVFLFAPERNELRPLLLPRTHRPKTMVVRINALREARRPFPAGADADEIRKDRTGFPPVFRVGRHQPVRSLLDQLEDAFHQQRVDSRITKRHAHFVTTLHVGFGRRKVPWAAISVAGHSDKAIGT